MAGSRQRGEPTPHSMQDQPAACYQVSFPHWLVSGLFLQPALDVDDPQPRSDDKPVGCARHGDRTSTRPDCCCRRWIFGSTTAILRPECTRQRDCSRERSPSWTAWTGAGERSPTRETIPRMQPYDEHEPSSSSLYKCVRRFDHQSDQRASASTATRPTATGRRHDSAP